VAAQHATQHTNVDPSMGRQQAAASDPDVLPWGGVAGRLSLLANCAKEPQMVCQPIVAPIFVAPILEPLSRHLVLSNTERIKSNESPATGIPSGSIKWEDLPFALLHD